MKKTSQKDDAVRDHFEIAYRRMRIDALKAKLDEMEQERGALLGALRGIQTMGIPAFHDGESDYHGAFSACVRVADKALEEFFKTQPPSSGVVEKERDARTTCNGSFDIALARRQVGPDGVIPGNARECAELWEKEARRLEARAAAAEKALRDLCNSLLLRSIDKTQPPSSGETERLEPASTSPASEVVATEVSHATGANDSTSAGPSPAEADSSECSTCEGVGLASEIATDYIVRCPSCNGAGVVKP